MAIKAGGRNASTFGETFEKYKVGTYNVATGGGMESMDTENTDLSVSVVGMIDLDGIEYAFVPQEEPIPLVRINAEAAHAKLPMVPSMPQEVKSALWDLDVTLASWKPPINKSPSEISSNSNVPEDAAYMYDNPAMINVLMPGNMANMWPVFREIYKDVPKEEVWKAFFEPAAQNMDRGKEITLDSLETSVREFPPIPPRPKKDDLVPPGYITPQLVEKEETEKSGFDDQYGKFHESLFNPQLDDISELIETFLGAIEKFSSALNEIRTERKNKEPKISGAYIDDVIRMKDPNVRELLFKAFGTTAIDRKDRIAVLKFLYEKQIKKALEYVKDFRAKTPTVDVKTDKEIMDILRLIKLDVKELLSGYSVTDAKDDNTREILGGTTTWKGKRTKVASRESNYLLQPMAGNTSTNETVKSDTYAFDYVDSLEEFEAEIASTDRDIDTMMVHMIQNPATDSNQLHDLFVQNGMDGMQFHFLVNMNGRVQRGAPVSASTEGDNVVHVALAVAKNMDRPSSIPQQRTLRLMTGSMLNLIPGMDVVEANQAENDPGADPGTGELFQTTKRGNVGTPNKTSLPLTRTPRPRIPGPDETDGYIDEGAWG